MELLDQIQVFWNPETSTFPRLTGGRSMLVALDSGLDPRKMNPGLGYLGVSRFESQNHRAPNQQISH